MSRLDRLKSVQTTVTDLPTAPPDPTTPTIQHSVHAHEVQTPDASSRAVEATFDKHFVVSNANPTCWQFYGSSSLFALTVEVLVHAQAKFGPVTELKNYTGSEFWLNSQGEEHAPKPRDAPDRATIERLVALFLASPNVLRTFIDDQAIMHDIEGYLACHGTDTRQLVSYQAHQFFRISMLCAIACANKARHQPSYTAESMQYYSEALRCVGEVTSEVSVESLIALLLLILFAMFYPRKGDIWKLLDFACRLSVELGYHTEHDEAFADEKSRSRRRRIFWGLYCIERSIGQHFGRPSDLPEEIITTEYPAALTSAPITDHGTFQSIAMSHYFRLVYLRSEIGRELYLPSRSHGPPLYWFQEKFANILAWRQELPVNEAFKGVGSITCDAAFESSFGYLFQPLIMKALAWTREADFLNENLDTIPIDGYLAACRLIELYVKILRAPEDSSFGMYPLTFISALHIQTAAMTIIAHCLLAIDGRIPHIMWKVGHHESTLRPSYFNNIYETSGSCLILLTKCAERWPGMIGLLDIYKTLSEKVLPILLRTGLA